MILKITKKKIDLKEFINLNNKKEVEDLYSLSQCDSIIIQMK